MSSENINEKIRILKAEIVQLEEIKKYNIKTKRKRGRPLKDEADKMTETVCFKITKSQKKRLEVVNNTMTLSDFIRQLIFGADEK